MTEMNYYTDEELEREELANEELREAEDEVVTEFYDTKINLEHTLEHPQMRELLSLIPTDVLFKFATNKGYIQDL